MIRKCLTVSPSNRFTVDDIVTHWWVNLGYKYPPVHYYLPPTMSKDHTVTSTNPLPAVTYNATKKTSNTTEDKPKSIVPSTRLISQPPHPLSIVAPSLQVQKERITDTELKRKDKINGHHPSKETPRSNDMKSKSNAPNTTTNNHKVEPLKSNPASRWTLNKKQNNGIPSKNPSTRPIVH